MSSSSEIILVLKTKHTHKLIIHPFEETIQFRYSIKLDGEAGAISVLVSQHWLPDLPIYCIYFIIYYWCNPVKMKHYVVARNIKSNQVKSFSWQWIFNMYLVNFSQFYLKRCIMPN